MGGDSSSCWLRIIQINDVYEFDNFPHLKTLLAAQHHRPHQRNGGDASDSGEKNGDATTDTTDIAAGEGEATSSSATAADATSQGSPPPSSVRKKPDKVLFVVAGDFLAPSLQSSLDQGTAMIDCLNALGCSYVCLGNHETDVSDEALAARIHQSTFPWINSNLRDLDTLLDVVTPESVVIDVVASSSEDGDAHKNQSENDGCCRGDSTKSRSTSTTKKTKRRVALLGLLTNDPSLYRPGSFANATMDSVIPTTETLVDKLLLSSSQDNNSDDGNHAGDGEVDLIIPLTHQSMGEDRALAERFGGSVFPIIIGGHEHIPFDETVNGCRIYKTGCDAHQAGIIDIKWGDDDQAGDGKQQPTISCQLLKTTDYPADAAMMERVRHHQKLVHDLECARLFPVRYWMGDSIQNATRRCSAFSISSYTEEERNQILASPPCSPGGRVGGSARHIGGSPGRSPGRPRRTRVSSSHQQEFSTLHNRAGPSTGSTALASMVRMGMRCECGLINAGGVRGNKVYSRDAFFTWKDLKTEISFPCPITTCYLPGHVLEAAITESRQGSRHDPPVPKGGYLHTCNNIVYSEETRSIQTIGGKPFDSEKRYLTSLPADIFDGIDDHTVILEWAAAEGFCLSHECARPAKLVIVQVFASMVWLQLGTASFDELDVDGDGFLSRQDIKRKMDQTFGRNGGVADINVDQVMSVADLNGDGKVSPLEMMIVQFAATGMLSSHVASREELDEMQDIVSRVLGHEATKDDVEQMVTKIRERIDVSGDGTIQREEIMNAVGDLSGRDLLS